MTKCVLKISKVVFFLLHNFNSYQQILHYHMEQNEYSHVIDTCKKYG